MSPPGFPPSQPRYRTARPSSRQNGGWGSSEGGGKERKTAAASGAGPGDAGGGEASRGREGGGSPEKFRVANMVVRIAPCNGTRSARHRVAPGRGGRQWDMAGKVWGHPRTGQGDVGRTVTKPGDTVAQTVMAQTGGTRTRLWWQCGTWVGWGRGYSRAPGRPRRGLWDTVKLWDVARGGSGGYGARQSAGMWLRWGWDIPGWEWGRWESTTRSGVGLKDVGRGGDTATARRGNGCDGTALRSERDGDTATVGRGHGHGGVGRGHGGVGRGHGAMGPPPTFSFLRALNFFRHSTVSCLCIMEATVERCCGDSGVSTGRAPHGDGVGRAGGQWGGGHTYADPRVLEGLVGGDALGRVDGQHLVDEVLGFGGDRVPLRGGELRGHSRTGRGGGGCGPLSPGGGRGGNGALTS